MADKDDTKNNLTPDQCAAHEFLGEIRNRITTQPLPYQYGIESSALKSLWILFDQVRETIKKYPGCKEFSEVASNVLNIDVRPITSKWHRAYEEGHLESRDGGDEFREDLQNIQKKLRKFANVLHKMAYGPDTEFQDQLTPSSAISEAELDQIFTDIKFGIPAGFQVSDDQFENINNVEAAEIKARREHYQIKTKEGFNGIGLALSGGGIRSATFGLGVVQVLADRKLLSQIDFLSTVSGGGYTGSFLTRRLGDGILEKELASPHGPDPEPIRYLRQQVKFLASKNLKESWSMFTATLGGMLLNWSSPFFCILVMSIVAVGIRKLLPDLEIWSCLFAWSAGLSGLCLIAYGWAMRWRQQYSRCAGIVLSGIAALTILIGIFWGLNIGYDTIQEMHQQNKLHWSTKAFFSSLLSTILLAPSVIRYLPVFENPKIRKIVLQILLWSACLIIPILFLTLFYVFWMIGDPTSSYGQLTGLQILGVGVFFLGIIAFAVLNINLTGPHRLYRDGLSKTFVQTSEESFILELDKINPNQTAPYHLVNAALNLPSSQNNAIRDRRCDFFLFSKHWMGSPAIGYQKTQEWKANGNPVDLATAMAISGAALSPHMGLGAMPTLVALLAFLNLRLGFWIKNPHSHSQAKHPGFRCLINEMFGIGMNEGAPWLNLSDGGHIENIAVYELLRRRCKFIICVDGEADPEFKFEGLMTLVRHAQIDFGVTIEPKLNELRTNEKTGLSKTHAHLCRIHYPKLNNGTEANTGLLLYLKLSVTGNESELIKRYRINHPEFPHQTTLDQFFDQEQFEAYRQLGVHVAEGLFSQALTGGSGQNLDTISEWFRSLARNLLLPEV